VAAAAFGSGLKSAGADALTEPGFRRHVFDPFVATVTERDLRRAALRRWLGQRLRPRARPRNLVLADVLAEALFPAVDRLVELPEHPQFVITGTELAAGRAFRFSRDFLGSWDFGYAATPPDLRVATAVAASAAAPPFIPSLQLDTSELALRNAPRVLTITDGGVYDNLGVEWFQGWSAARRPPAAIPAQDLIVINASGPLGRVDHSLVGVAALNRMRKVQYAQTQATRVRWLVADMENGRRQGMYFGLTGDPRRYRLPPPTRDPISPACYHGALPSSLVGALASLRTDFNRFSSAEALLLAYHGYWSTHARYASLRPAAAVGDPRWKEFANMSGEDEARLEHELRGRRHRMGVGEPLR
jgi:predicted acylesterase/phospholipase RssA